MSSLFGITLGKLKHSFSVAVQHYIGLSLSKINVVHNGLLDHSERFDVISTRVFCLTAYNEYSSHQH